MPRAANRPCNLTIKTDARPKLRQGKTVAELTPASRQAHGRGCRCSVRSDRHSEILLVFSESCPHHRGLNYWHKKERRGWA